MIGKSSNDKLQEGITNTTLNFLAPDKRELNTTTDKPFHKFTINLTMIS